MVYIMERGDYVGYSIEAVIGHRGKRFRAYRQIRLAFISMYLDVIWIRVKTPELDLTSCSTARSMLLILGGGRHERVGSTRSSTSIGRAYTQ